MVAGTRPGQRLSDYPQETYAIEGTASGLAPRARLSVRAGDKSFEVLARIDTPQEVVTYRHGGILPFVLRELAASS